MSGTGGAQPQIFTREGVSLLTFNRGDPYVTDMARTTGHVTIVSGGEWHPHETASQPQHRIEHFFYYVWGVLRMGRDAGLEARVYDGAWLWRAYT